MITPPHFDGIETYERIREFISDQIAIISSGYQ